MISIPFQIDAERGDYDGPPLSAKIDPDATKQ